MYLVKRIFVGSNYEYRGVTGKVELTTKGSPIKVNLDKIYEIVEEACYWRKANQVHGWFVREIQDGVDDCKEYYVPFLKLLELKELCNQAVKTKDSTLLPPCDGFFYGSTAVDEVYFDELRDTIEIINGLDESGSYFYRSSW